MALFVAAFVTAYAAGVIPEPPDQSPPTPGERWSMVVAALVWAGGLVTIAVLAARRQRREHPPQASQAEAS